MTLLIAKARFHPKPIAFYILMRSKALPASHPVCSCFLREGREWFGVASFLPRHSNSFNRTSLAIRTFLSEKKQLQKSIFFPPTKLHFALVRNLQRKGLRRLAALLRLRTEVRRVPGSYGEPPRCLSNVFLLLCAAARTHAALHLLLRAPRTETE